MRLAAFLLLSVYTSCLVPDPKTHIVMMTEEGGCADSAHSSLKSIQTCLRAHEALATQIAPECKYQVQHTPNAHWGDTTEGRICQAAIPIASFRFLMNFKAVN